MQLAGFAVGGTAVLGCSRGVEHGVMPYLIRPEEVTPGRAYWYASVCGACPAGCGILAKDRDGRPIKLEGNPDHPLSGRRALRRGSGQRSGPLRLPPPAQPVARRGLRRRGKQVDREIARLAPDRCGPRVGVSASSPTQGYGPAERESVAAFLSGFRGRTPRDVRPAFRFPRLPTRTSPLMGPAWFRATVSIGRR